MSYRVELTKHASKQLAKLDKKSQLLIASFIDNKLNGCDDPCSLPSAKKLQDVENGWCWRVGVYRILGTVDNERIVIELFCIGHRRDVYRGL